MTKLIHWVMYQPDQAQRWVYWKGMGLLVTMFFLFVYYHSAIKCFVFWYLCINWSIPIYDTIYSFRRQFIQFIQIINSQALSYLMHSNRHIKMKYVCKFGQALIFTYKRIIIIKGLITHPTNPTPHDW